MTMEWYEIELDGSRTCKFPDHILPGYEQHATRSINERGISADYVGGILNSGKWGWLTRQNGFDATLLICALATGERVARHTFWRENDKKLGQVTSKIQFVEELFPGEENERLLLAVCIQVGDVKTDLAIYTPTSSQVLRYIDLHSSGISISSMRFFDSLLCRLTLMHNFDGCLAVGTYTGRVILLDLNADHVVSSRSKNIRCPDRELQRARVKCKDWTEVNWNTVDMALQKYRQQDIHLALEVDMRVDVVSRVTSLLPIQLISGFAAGLQDGRILIYDLNSNRLVTILGVSSIEPNAVVMRLCYILPPDDPKPCFYICAVCNQGRGLITTVYALNFKYAIEMEESKSEFQYRQFQDSCIRVRLLLDENPCTLIDCKAISTFSFVGDNGTLLIAISWHSHTNSKNKFILFDVNQWYRDEMPSHPRQEKANYLCGYVLSGLHSGLSLEVDASTVMYFISQQRYDEHFYPNSLSFECSLLTVSGCRRYSHLGVQRRFLGAMCSQRASLFLNPEPYQKEIVNLRLLPQFYEYSSLNASFFSTKRHMYELILSVALEHNRLGLLNSCVQNCLDGSFMCDMLSSTKLSLSILTNWIVKRAGQIKERCAELCYGIFVYGGYSLDERERDEFKLLNGQLLRLQQLQLLIRRLGKSRVSSDLLEDLQMTEQTLLVLYEYHRVVFWLIEYDILPEGYEFPTAGVAPLKLIRRDYQERRKLSETRMYIDELLQFGGFLPKLNDTPYPPESMISMMHLWLVPDIQLSHKYELLLYLLLDWDELESRSSEMRLFDEFVLAFDIKSPLILSVRSFWLLDRGQVTSAVEELYKSPSENNNYTDWQTKLLLDVLLANGAVKQAMQVLDRPPGPISSKLRLQVLLANNNIPEAFHHARLYQDDLGNPLLEYFFEHCIRMNKFKVLGSLCLRQHEEQLVYRLLRQCKTRQTDAVQLIMLLKRCQYIEAVSFMNEVAAEEQRSNLGDNLHEETNSLLTAYRSTMAPVTQFIAGTYFRIRENFSGDHLRNSAPEPFSCQLAKQNATGQLGGIFQSSALSAHWATRYVNEPRSLNSGNMPFLRNAAQAKNQLPQQNRLVRPQPVQPVEKRTLLSSVGEQSQPALKRRRLLGEQFDDEVNSIVQHSLQIAMEQKKEEQQLQLHNKQEVQALLTPPTYLEFKPNSQPVVEPSRRPNILKSRTVESSALRDDLLEQFNSFRFLPPTLLEESQVADHEWVVQHDLESERAQEQNNNGMELDEEETDEIFVEFEQRPSSVILSHESSIESDSEFLSPLASANVSFALIQQQGEMEQNRAQQQKWMLDQEREREREQEQQEVEQKDDEEEQPKEQLLEQEQLSDEEQRMSPPKGPQPRSSLLQSRSGQESSGFGSYHSNMQVTNTCSLQLEQFVPPVCSSKMYELPSTSLFASSTVAQVKISERTTICGDLEEPSVLAATSLWPMASTVPSRVAETQPLQLQMDTTLGMSSYDMTAAEPVDLVIELKAKQPIAEEQEQQEQEEEEQEQQEQEQQEQEQQEQEQEEQEEEDQADEHGQEEEGEAEQSSIPNSEEDVEEEEPASAMDYHQPSPSYSISSELSTMSSNELSSSHPARQDAPVYSIVVESTNSITTSRSPTSHTPTSFLPSDTNVSQNSNSSPRAGHEHGGSGDVGAGAVDGGAQRSLYRANSLETVDDLDTTKGSLEEDDDVDMDEDECVIALDGTEVRGYVARPEPVAACSSAELFAFKQKTEDQECAGQQHAGMEAGEDASQLPCPSLGATANSDSVQAYTINLDSSNDGPPVAVTLTTCRPAMLAAAIEDTSSNDSVSSSIYSERRFQPVVRLRRAKLSGSSTSSTPSTHDQRTSPTELSPRSTSISLTHRRSLRNSVSQHSDDMPTPECTPKTSGGSMPRYRLRSADSTESVVIVRRQTRAGSLPAMSTVPVSTPKRRQKVLPKPLEVIQENESMRRTRSRTRLSQVQTPVAEILESMQEASGSGFLRSTSEPPIMEEPQPTSKRGRPQRRASTNARATPTSTMSITPTTSGRVLRSQRNSLLEQPASPAPAADPPAPETQNLHEIIVPLKKRGRNKKE